RAGVSVHTTLDVALQDRLLQHMRDHLWGDDRDTEGRLIREDDVSNAAALLVEHRSGAIRALLGSVDYDDARIGGNFDVATQAYRAPASTFKPIVYAEAFRKGWFPAMRLADMPATFPLEGVVLRKLTPGAK